MESSRLFVGNLEPEVKEKHLREVFEQYGTITDIIRRGPVGILTFSKPEEMLKALKTEGGRLAFEGRRAKVDAFKDLPPRRERQRKRSASPDSRTSEDDESISYDKDECKSSTSMAKDVIIISTDDTSSSYVHFVQNVKNQIRSADFWYVHYSFRTLKTAVYDFIYKTIEQDRFWAAIFVMPNQARLHTITKLDIYENNAIAQSWKAITLETVLKNLNEKRGKTQLFSPALVPQFPTFQFKQYANASTQTDETSVGSGTIGGQKVDLNVKIDLGELCRGNPGMAMQIQSLVSVLTAVTVSNMQQQQQQQQSNITRTIMAPQMMPTHQPEQQMQALNMMQVCSDNKNSANPFDVLLSSLAHQN